MNPTEQPNATDLSVNFSEAGRIKVFLFSDMRISEDGNLILFLQPDDIAEMNRILAGNLKSLLSAGSELHFIEIIMHDRSDVADNTATGQLPEQFHFSNVQDCLDALKERHTGNALFILFNGTIIGLTAEGLEAAMNLTGIEDDTAVVFFDTARRICGVVANRYSDALVLAVLDKVSCDEFFTKAGDDYFWIQRNDVLTVRSRDDFKSLYHLISSKEGMRVCSREYYDQLTELFIEYKEFLR